MGVHRVTTLMYSTVELSHNDDVLRPFRPNGYRSRRPHLNPRWVAILSSSRSGALSLNLAITLALASSLSTVCTWCFLPLDPLCVCVLTELSHLDELLKGTSFNYIFYSSLRSYGTILFIA